MTPGGPSEPATPYLRVEVARLQRNIDRAATSAAGAGVTLRPHVKTHKCLEIARRQLAAGARGITVATVGEAEVFAADGVDDILIAYPLWLTEESAARLRRLAQQARVTIGIDSVESSTRSAALLPGTGVTALVEVDSGHHRSGVAPGDAGPLAAASAVPVRGVFTFPGHSYAPGATRSAAHDEARCLAAAATSLRANAVPVEVVSGGSTPSLDSSLADTGLLTELRPGVYVFGDAQQWELGTVAPADISLTCRSTVISHAGGRLVIDAGSKALGADRAAYATGFGRLLEHPDARVVMLSEHHAVVEGTPLLPLGSRVDVVPNHVCNAVNLAETLWADDGADLAPWHVAARGRNT